MNEFFELVHAAKALGVDAYENIRGQTNVHGLKCPIQSEIFTDHKFSLSETSCKRYEIV